MEVRKDTSLSGDASFAASERLFVASFLQRLTEKHGERYQTEDLYQSVQKAGLFWIHRRGHLDQGLPNFR